MTTTDTDRRQRCGAHRPHGSVSSSCVLSAAHTLGGTPYIPHFDGERTWPSMLLDAVPTPDGTPPPLPHYMREGAAGIGKHVAEISRELETANFLLSVEKAARDRALGRLERLERWTHARTLIASTLGVLVGAWGQSLFGWL